MIFSRSDNEKATKKHQVPQEVLAHLLTPTCETSQGLQMKAIFDRLSNPDEASLSDILIDCRDAATLLFRASAPKHCFDWEKHKHYQWAVMGSRHQAVQLFTEQAELLEGMIHEEHQELLTSMRELNQSADRALETTLKGG